jgi:hypothetical protein
LERQRTTTELINFVALPVRGVVLIRNTRIS